MITTACHYCGEEGHYKADCPHRSPYSPHPEIEVEKSISDGCRICGSRRHWAIACPLHPTRLRRIQGASCGPGPCTGACRSGEHEDCAYAWCECKCHRIAFTLING
jgi:hypothetical protein